MHKFLSYVKATQQLTRTEKVGQLFMPAAFVNDSEEEIQAMEKLIAENHIGGLCFFHSRASAATNFEGKKRVVYNKESFKTLQDLIQRYQKKSSYRLLIAIDAEWGLAMRIENTPQYPYALTLGAIQDAIDLVFQVGKNIASDCKQAGIHLNLAPVVDINSDPKNPVIGYRSFGEDKINVTKKSMAYLKGLQSEGVLGSVKHFPGHGDTAVDSHLGLPVIDKSKEDLMNNELYPFRKLIEHGVASVMVGHLAVPSLSNGHHIPSSLSKDMIKGLLRDELGFTGVVISDALNMHAVSKNYTTNGELEWLAFDAGNDILCFAEHIPAGMDMILEKATEAQIEEAFKRVWSLKEKAIRAEVDDLATLIDPNDLNTEIAKASISLIQGSEDHIAHFRKNGFIGITNTTEVEKSFLGMLGAYDAFRTYSLTDASDATFEDIEKEGNILLSLEPPQVKPTNLFGFTEDEISRVNELLNTKNVIVYLFGNPYALQLFNYHKANTIVVCYQNFKVFQEVAASHFRGRLPAKGKFPVDLK